MCVIAVAETRRISRDELMLQWDANPHGGGIAYIKDGQVHYEKGFESPEALWKAIKKLPLPYVVHTRIATAGGIRRDLTHPFPITDRVGLALKGSCKAVLFHNGHWHGYEMAKSTLDKALGELRGAISDSRIMARILAVQGIEARSIVPESQRLCLLSADDGVTMQGAGWANHSGMWTSNCSWQWARSPQTAKIARSVWTRRPQSDPYKGSLHTGTSTSATVRYLSQGTYKGATSFVGEARAKAKQFASDIDRDVMPPTRSQLQQQALDVLAGRVSGDDRNQSRFRWREDDNDRLVLLGPDVTDEPVLFCTEEADCDCNACRALGPMVRVPEDVE